MAGLKGNSGTLRQWGRDIRALPRTLAADVARRGAPEITGLARGAYSSGQTVYGEPRPLGVDGQALTLEQTGATKAQVRFVAVGTVVRCVLGPRWARYLIGKYGILPNGQAAIPAGWVRRLDKVVQDTPPGPL